MAKKETAKKEIVKKDELREEKMKALENALTQLNKTYGKGSVMKFSDKVADTNLQVISTGCLDLDMALGVGGLPRGRVVEIYGPESSGKTTVALHCVAEAQKAGGVAAFIDAEHALDPVYAKKLGVNIDDLYISQPDTGEQALEICEALVFIVAFFRDLKRWKRYLGQFAAFLAVSVPPAVAWPLYHLLAFDLPLNYVRLPAETIYVGHLSLWQRFGIPDWFARRTLFYTGVRKTDHNVWMQTLKTAVFDELTLFENGTVLWYVAYLLMALFAGLVLIGFVLFVRMLLRRPARLSGLGATFLGVYGAALAGNYVKFCVDYPYICSFNFRYIAPLLLLGALGIAAGRSRAHPCAGRCLSVYTGLFALLATGVYAVWFFSPVR